MDRLEKRTINLSVPDRPCTHPLTAVLDSKNTPARILDEALAIQAFTEDDLRAFDLFANKHWDDSNCEKFLEVFLKISGLHGHEWPGLSCGFANFAIFSRARRILADDSDSRTAVLAYLVCLDRSKLYTGPHEVFYIIDYLFKDRPAAVATIWATKCTRPFTGTLLGRDCSDFFTTEMLCLDNFEALATVITARKSHRILYNRLEFVKAKLGSDCSLYTLLTQSYDPENTEFTEKILIKMKNEKLTKKFILETGMSTGCLFVSCRGVDGAFYRCMEICVDHLGLITDKALGIVINSEWKVKTLPVFKKILEVLVARNYKIPVRKLLSMRKDEHSSLRQDWRAELLSRTNLLLDVLEDPTETIPFVRKAVSTAHAKESVGLIFRVRSLGVLKSFVKRKNMTEYVEAELRKKEYSDFYCRAVKYLYRGGFLGRVQIEQIVGSEDDPFGRLVLDRAGIKEQKQPSGLYFNGGKLVLRDLYKKFYLSVQIGLFKELLRDMVIIKMDGVEIRVETGEIELAVAGRVAGTWRMTGLAIDVLVRCEHGQIDVSVNGCEAVRVQHRARAVQIGEDFRGVVHGLFYSETMEVAPMPLQAGGGPFFKALAEYGKNVVIPIQRLLVYKNRKGIWASGGKVLWLGRAPWTKGVEMKDVFAVG